MLFPLNKTFKMQKKGGNFCFYHDSNLIIGELKPQQQQIIACYSFCKAKSTDHVTNHTETISTSRTTYATYGTFKGTQLKHHNTTA